MGVRVEQEGEHWTLTVRKGDSGSVMLFLTCEEAMDYIDRMRTVWGRR